MKNPDFVSPTPSLPEACPFARVASGVGNTPLARLHLRHRGRAIVVCAKLEMFNLSGSIKDRMALAIMRAGYAAKRLSIGQPIVEATSGNAGIAFSAIGGALGHPVTIFMPDWMSVERRQLLAAYGADVRLVSREDGGFLGAIALARTHAERTGAFLPAQFDNPENCAAHARGTLPELWAQMQLGGLSPGAFVAGVGTGGTVMGAANYLRAIDSTIAVHPVEPAQSPTLTTGHKVGHHRMQGISDEFIPAIVDLDRLDAVISISDGDAIVMAQRLARELGLGVGISSGGNLLAAVRAAALLQGEVTIATVFADSNLRYLSTDLARVEPACADHLSLEIEFTDCTLISGLKTDRMSGREACGASEG